MGPGITVIKYNSNKNPHVLLWVLQCLHDALMLTLTLLWGSQATVEMEATFFISDFKVINKAYAPGGRTPPNPSEGLNRSPRNRENRFSSPMLHLSHSGFPDHSKSLVCGT